MISEKVGALNVGREAIEKGSVAKGREGREVHTLQGPEEAEGEDLMARDLPIALTEAEVVEEATPQEEEEGEAPTHQEEETQPGLADQTDLKDQEEARTAKIPEDMTVEDVMTAKDAVEAKDPEKTEKAATIPETAERTAEAHPTTVERTSMM